MTFFSRAAVASLLAASIQHSAFASTEASFSYDPTSATGPAFWGDLAIDNNECSGDKNSPINVETSSCTDFADYQMTRGTCAYNDMSYAITKNGVQANIPDTCEASTVEIPGVEGTYKALQFHIHTSSEHTLNGNRFSAELHTVHKQIDGDRYAVVGMMIQPDAFEDNEEFGLLLQGWVKKEEEVLAGCGINATSPEMSALLFRDASEELSEDVFSPYDLLPEGQAFYHYDGGLTTPPCSEVVWWNLADKPVSVSVWQYAELVQLIVQYRDAESCELLTLASASGGTSRPVQPLNGREVKRICPVGFKEEATDSSAATLSVSLAAIATAMAGFFL